MFWQSGWLRCRGSPMSVCSLGLMRNNRFISIRQMSAYNQLQGSLDELRKRQIFLEKRGVMAGPNSLDDFDDDILSPELSKFYAGISKFQNQYICHNPSIIFSNSTRNLLLRYYQLSRDRQTQEYQLTQK